MKGFVLLLALYMGALGPTFAIAAGDPPHNSQADFVYACKVLDYDCTELSPPEILWSDLYSQGLLGVYNGEEAIHMDNTVLRFADVVYVDSIIAHETVHYLDMKLGIIALPFSPTVLCETEMRARRVGNAYLLTHGRPDLIDYEWFKQYGCFQQ